MQNDVRSVRIWDLVVRTGHWSLVIGFCVAYITEDDFMTAHVWAGYVVTSVVLIRIVWGFTGSKHARFSDFIYSPTAVLDYLRELFTSSAKHYMGHNPAAGAMVCALLIGLIGTVSSGLVLYAVEEDGGPLAGLMTADTSFDIAFPGLVPGAYADDDDEHENGEHRREQGGNRHEEHDEDEFWEEVHEIFANLTLLLVVLHVAGVLASSYVHDENLIRSMITGYKRRNSS